MCLEVQLIVLGFIVWIVSEETPSGFAGRERAATSVKEPGTVAWSQGSGLEDSNRLKEHRIQRSRL